MVILSLARAGAQMSAAYVRFVGLGHAAGFALEVPAAEDMALSSPDRLEFVLSTGRLSVRRATDDAAGLEVVERG